MLIVINGPIASGKSTIARAVVTALRDRGRRAAVIDVDLLYDMLDDAVDAPKGDESSWGLARRGAAVLSETYLSAGVDAVIVEGRFFEEERRVFLEALGPDVTPRYVTLQVSYEEALRRAQGDPTRGVSRDPAFLGPYFTAIAWDVEAVPPTDLVIDTEQLSVAETVRGILTALT